MKFCATYRIPHENWLPVLKKFSSMTPAERVDTGEGVKLVGRWAAMSSRSGVAIFESDSLASVERYIGKWNPYMEIDLAPVLDDEEMATVAKQVIADNAVP